MAAARTRNSFTVSDAENKNNSSLNSRVYSDLDLFFTKRSVDKDVNTLTNVQAIKRSVRNLVLTNFYEKPFHPEIGCGVRGLLFENASPLTSIALSQACEDVIANYEPRARTIGVDIIPKLDSNSYDLTINFTIVNAPSELVSLNILLEVLR